MSLDAMNWVWEHSQSKGVARLVMLAIADRVTTPDCKAYAGLSALQERANAGRSTVIGVLRDLVAMGELEIVEYESGRNGATVYRLPKALGHVRGGSERADGSVQISYRSGRHNRSRIGAETAPIPDPDGASAGAETAPIHTSAPDWIGAETAPIAPEPEPAIGADSGPESVQILDSIGADSAPHNQEQLLNQEEIYIPGVAARSEAKPKRARTPKRDDRAPVEPAAFAAFWSAYPKKDSKPAAVKAWNAAVADRGADPKTLIDGAARYRAWDGRNPAYTKNPSTWLNNDCWEDPYVPVGRGDHRSYQNPSDDDYEGDL